MRETIFNASWEELLPKSIRQDKRMYAMAQAIAEQKRRVAAEIWRVQVWENIDKLPEEILDVLAYDLKIDWWDSSLGIEEKRKTIRYSWYIHKKIGTPAAVERAVSTIYPKNQVEEWFQYDGEPGYFRLRIDGTKQEMDLGRHMRMLERVDYYKNVRSWLQTIIFDTEIGTETIRMGGTMATVTRQPVPQIEEQFAFQETIRVAAAAANRNRIGIPEAEEPISMQRNGSVGARGGVIAAVPVPEITQ